MSNNTTPNSTVQLNAPVNPSAPKLSAILSNINQPKQDVEEKQKTCPVQVVVRCRPINEREKLENARSILSFPPGRTSVSFSAKGSKQVKDYPFDYVYPPEVGQEEVFNTTVAPIVNEVMKGFSCTIFAYGQTGTGKTYTMEGFRSFESLGANATLDTDAGIIPRAVHQIFKTLEQSSTEYTVRVSFLELYNEELNDLLGSSSDPLKIFEDPAKKGISVHGLEEVPVNTAEDIFKILERGLKQRQVAETNLNKNSSRSHCIFSVIIHTKEATPEGEDLLKVGKLNLVDLAGSENIGRSGAQKERKREAGLINQSLLTLGRVITALTDHSPHVPYRESKLTRLLQDSLGGKTKTCIIATVSPSNLCMEETISTLDYACRAKNIRNTPTVNQKMTKKAVLRELEQEIVRLRDNLRAAREGKSGFYVAQETFTEMELTIETSKETIKNMEMQLQSLEVSRKEVEDLFTLKQSELQEKERHLYETKMTLTQTAERLMSTEQALSEVQEVVEDQKVVIQEHEQVEKTLQENAVTLINTLQETITDVDGLYSKIDRKKMVEDENKRKFNEFSRYIVSRVKQSQNQLDKFKEDQANVYSQLESTIVGFVEEKDQEIAFLRAKVDQLWSLLTDSQRALQSLTESHRDTVGVNLQTLESSQISHLNHVEDAAETFLRESADVVGTIRTQLTQHKHNVSRWQSETRSKLHRTQSHAANFVGQQKEALQIVKETMKTSSTQQKTRLQSHQQSVQKILVQQQDQSKQFQETLLQQMNLLMNNFVQTQEQQLNRAIEEMNSHFQSESTVLDEFCFVVEKNTDVIESRMEEHLSSISSDLKSQEDSLDVHAKYFDVLDQFIETHHQQLEENTSSSIGRLVSVEKGHIENVQQTLQKGTSTLQEYCQLHHNAVSQFMEAEKAVHTEFGAQLDNTSESIKNQVLAWAERVATQRNGVDSFHQLFSNDVAEVKAELGNFFSTIKEDKPTGTTPVKKLRTFPTNIPKPRPQSMLSGKKAKNQSSVDKENTDSQAVNTL